MAIDEATLVELTTPEVKHSNSSHRVHLTRVHLIGLTAVVVLLGAVGNLSLAWGMKHIALSMGLQPLAYMHAIASPFVGLGVVLLILWLLTRMALLSRSDLSFVLPATGIGYVLNAVMAALILKEFISPYRWFGTLLIVAGAALVGSDPKGLSTSGPRPERASEN